MKTLVIYGSRRGSTKHCAELIEKTLDGESSILDVQSRNIESELNGYEKIIIGANAFNFKLNKKVSSFLRKNLKILSQKEIHFFICSGSQGEADVKTLFEKSYPLELLKKAESMKNFGGRLIVSNESWLIKRILKKMDKKDYDTINEKAIIGWASNL